MSTYLYLVCDAHPDPVTSEEEVGQHLYDLPAVRACLNGHPMHAQFILGLDSDALDLPRHPGRLVCLAQ